MFNFLALLESEFLVAYINIVASDWPCTFFTPKVFLFSICVYVYVWPYRVYNLLKPPIFRMHNICYVICTHAFCLLVALLLKLSTCNHYTLNTHCTCQVVL